MGGFDIDLRDADIAGDAARIEVFVMIGGHRPEGAGELEGGHGGDALHGRRRLQLEERRAPAEGPQKVLTVSGFVFMGGVEVKQ